MEVFLRFLSLVLTAALLAPVAAKADTFNFNVTGSADGFTGSGTFTGTSNTNGSYTITGITGPSQFGTITVAPVGSFTTNDNRLFPTSSSLVDFAGIAFSGAFGEEDLFSLNGSYFVRGLDSNSDAFFSPVDFSLSNSSAVTPEPSSLLLTFTGLLAGAAVLFRKRLFSSMAVAQPVL